MRREMMLGAIYAQLYSLTDRHLSVLLQQLSVNNAKVPYSRCQNMNTQTRPRIGSRIRVVRVESDILKIYVGRLGTVCQPKGIPNGAQDKIFVQLDRVRKQKPISLFLKPEYLTTDIDSPIPPDVTATEVQQTDVQIEGEGSLLELLDLEVGLSEINTRIEEAESCLSQVREVETESNGQCNQDSCESSGDAFGICQIDSQPSTYAVESAQGSHSECLSPVDSNSSDSVKLMTSAASSYETDSQESRSIHMCDRSGPKEASASLPQVYSSQKVDQCQHTKDQKLQQTTGGFISKDLVAHKLQRSLESQDSQSGTCLETTGTTSEEKSNFPSSNLKESGIPRTTMGITDAQSVIAIGSSTGSFGSATTEPSRTDITSTTSTVKSQTTDPKTSSASRQATTQGCTGSSKNTDLSSDRYLITLKQSGGWTQEKSTHLQERPVEQLAETAAQSHKLSKTVQNQQEHTGNGYKCSNLKHLASSQGSVGLTYQQENLASEQPSLSRSNPSASNVCEDISQVLLSTTTSAPLTQRKENGKLYMEGFLAKTFPVPTPLDEDLMVSAQDSGKKCSELSDTSDHDLLSLRTLKLSDVEDLLKLSITLPKAGMWGNGSVYSTLR